MFLWCCRLSCKQNYEVKRVLQHLVPLPLSAAWGPPAPRPSPSLESYSCPLSQSLYEWMQRRNEWVAGVGELASAARRAEPTGQWWRQNSIENSSIMEYKSVLFSMKREDSAPAGRHIRSSRCGVLQPRQGSSPFAFTPFLHRLFSMPRASPFHLFSSFYRAPTTHTPVVSRVYQTLPS